MPDLTSMRGLAARKTSSALSGLARALAAQMPQMGPPIAMEAPGLTVMDNRTSPVLSRRATGKPHAAQGTAPAGMGRVFMAAPIARATSGGEILCSYCTPAHREAFAPFGCAFGCNQNAPANLHIGRRVAALLK